MLPRPLLIATLSLMSAILLRAQIVEPAELLALRKQFTTRSVSVAHTLSDQYTKALASLEHELAAAGDYEAAEATQRRRQDIAAIIKTALGETSANNAIVLKPSEAKVSGSVTYEHAANALVGWRKVGSAATWDVLKTTPGTYQISVTYESTGDATGEYDFFEDSSLTGSEANHRITEVKPTDGKFTVVQLAPMTLQRTSARFTMRVTRVRGVAPLMNVKEISLTPVTVAAPADKVDASSKDDFTALQQSYATKIKTIARPLSDNYLSKLSEIESKLDKQEDGGILAALNAERDRVQRWLLNPIASIPAPHNGKVSATLSAEGFTVIAEDARFVPDATNTGDIFRVTHGEQTLALRLLWVACPPPEPDDKAALAVHAKYFNITPEEAVSVGKEAQEFTASVLTDKPLRILSRGQKDKDGRVLSVVVPEGMEDLATILVENGLAAVTPPLANTGLVRRAIFSPLLALKEREAAVKARPITPGAWGLSGK